jgi:cysteine-rich repeat protein
VGLDDGIGCTLDDCDDVTGEITHTPWSDFCDPGLLCQHGVCDAEEGCLLETTLDCCGNGLVEAGEACDDGNDQDGDGCTAGCVDENPVVTLGPNIQVTANLAHTTMARFDDHHTATVYASTEDPEIDPAYYRIAIHARVGKDLTWKGDWYFDTPVPAPGPSGTGSAFEIFAAVGPNHLIAVTSEPGVGRVFNTYKWDGADELALLSSTPMDDGKGFFWGHPVDDTRFIWRYRYDNSGEPVTYQVITRDGDTFSFGAEMVRPGPENFPGLSDNISQAEPILMRMGPTTFREIRPGYVWDPGYLASYTLEVSGADLSWSAPVVHDASGNRTMEPLVAADGQGGGAVIFPNYDAEHYQWAVYEAGSANLQVQGPVFNGLSFYGQGAFESTDAHVGGAYFLRIRDGHLYRVKQDSGTWLADPFESDLAYHACAYAPHITRVGTLGLFLRCTGTNQTAYLRVIDLYPSCGDGVLDEGEVCDDGGNVSGDGCSSVCTIE